MKYSVKITKDRIAGWNYRVEICRGVKRIKVDWSFTIWGARFAAWTAIRNDSRYPQGVVAEYEVNK